MIARGFRRDRSTTAAIKFTGHIEVRGRTISVSVAYEDRELTRIPKLYLLNRQGELPDAVAHIEDENRVCYVREEHLLLDPLNPRGSVALCLIKMRDALDRLISCDLSEEIARELPQHWAGMPAYIDLSTTFSGAARLYTLGASRKPPTLLIAPSRKNLARFDAIEWETHTAAKTGLLIHILAISQELTFRPGQRPPTTFADLLSWLRSFSPQTAQRLVEILPVAWPNPLSFLLHAPNGSVGGTLKLPILIRRSVQRIQGLRRMLPMWANQIPISKIHGIRLDTEFIVRRNMHDQSNLSRKRILLVGVGTIGGFVAKFLAQSGAGTGGGQLVLVDEQKFSPGNIGRHFLGFQYIDKSKSEAMREELRRSLPDSKVLSLNESILDHRTDMTNFDLVIDATGDMALSEVINQDFVQARRNGRTSAAILYVWLAGNGVAAQALMVDDDVHACFRCLRHGNPSQERFQLLRQDHPARLTPANCGEGAYFAYGVGSPAIAAGLAIQMSLDWAKGRPSPRFRTIRVVNEATFAVKDSDVSRHPRCPVCAAA